MTFTSQFSACCPELGRGKEPGRERTVLLSVAFPVATQLSLPTSSDQLPPQRQAYALGVCLGQCFQPEPLASHLTVQAQPLLPAVTGPLADPRGRGWLNLVRVGTFPIGKAQELVTTLSANVFPLAASRVHH